MASSLLPLCCMTLLAFSSRPIADVLISQDWSLGAQEEDKAKDWLLQYKHVALAHGIVRAATVVLLLSQLAGLSTAFTSLIRARAWALLYSMQVSH